MVAGVPTAYACEFSEKAVRLLDGIRKLSELEERLRALVQEGSPSRGDMDR